MNKVSDLQRIAGEVSEVKTLVRIVDDTFEYSILNASLCPDITLILKNILERFDTIEDNLDKMIYKSYLNNQKH